MELQEKVTALEAEKKQYISMIDNLNGEKIALDQMLVESLKQTLAARKDSIMKDAKINELVGKINGLDAKIAELTKEKEQLQNSLSVMASDANCGG